MVISKGIRKDALFLCGQAQCQPVLHGRAAVLLPVHDEIQMTAESPALALQAHQLASQQMLLQ